jgi:hypothetical protein
MEMVSDKDNFMEKYEYLGHTHYACKYCGETFCGDDVQWAYHECKRIVFEGEVIESDYGLDSPDINYWMELSEGDDNYIYIDGPKLKTFVGKRIRVIVEERQ